MASMKTETDDHRTVEEIENEEVAGAVGYDPDIDNRADSGVNSDGDAAGEDYGGMDYDAFIKALSRGVEAASSEFRIPVPTRGHNETAMNLIRSGFPAVMIQEDGKLYYQFGTVTTKTKKEEKDCDRETNVSNESPLGSENQELEQESVEANEEDHSQNSGRNFNYEILENLFAVCPAEYLSTFRYVCKEWNKAALQAWRNEAQIVIVNFQNRPRKLYFQKLLNLPELISMINDSNDPLKLKSDKNYQFRKYKLESWYMTLKDTNIVTFWNHFGSFVNQLELANTRVEKMDTILAILYEKLPNLRSLTLDKIFVMRSRAGSEEQDRFNSMQPNENVKVLKIKSLKHFPVEWDQFLKHFPKIEILESYNTDTDRDLELILAAIRLIRLESVDTLSIKSLSIIRGDSRKNVVRELFSVDLRRILMECDLPLESLHLKLGCAISCGVIKDIIQHFPDNLKKFSFHVDYKCYKKEHKFPYMVQFPALEELELWQWCIPETHLHKILYCMPNLKVLKVNGIKNLFQCNDKYYEDFISKNGTGASKNSKKEQTVKVCTTLKEFSFFVFNVTPSKLKYLLFLAPNLTKLEIKVDNDNETFRDVCQKLPNLSEFVVWGKTLTDDAITGLSESGNQPTLPNNITNLKYLRVFALREMNRRLTDKSVVHGFLKVPKLFTLQLSLLENQISQEARKALEQNIPNLVLREIKTNAPNEEESSASGNLEEQN